MKEMNDAASASEAPQHPAEDDHARAYNRVRRRLSILGFALNAALLLVLLFGGVSVSLRDVAWRATTNIWVAVFVYGLLLALLSKLVSLPLDYYSGFMLEHRYNLSNLTRSAWIKDSLKAVAIAAVFGLVALEVVYYTLRRFPDHWWLLCWAVFAVFSILLATLAPVLLFPLFYKFTRIEDQALRDRLVRLSERAGAQVRDVMEWKLSEKSKKANAALVGLGGTRRIILADTLLRDYSADEMEAILAHELAHHVYNHIWKGMMLQLALSFVAFWTANRALTRFTAYFGYRGIADFANLPLLLATTGVLSLIVLPLVNALSRHNERQADNFALRMIPDVNPFVSSMRKLAGQNLAEQQPNRIIEFLFHSHPSMEKRIRRAERFALSEPRV